MGRYILVLELSSDTPGIRRYAIPFEATPTGPGSDGPLKLAEMKAGQILTSIHPKSGRLVRKYIQRVS